MASKKERNKESKKNSEERGLRSLNVGLSIPARIWEGQNPTRQGNDPTLTESNTTQVCFNSAG
jgi:hypothetical protein